MTKSWPPHGPRTPTRGFRECWCRRWCREGRRSSSAVSRDPQFGPVLLLGMGGTLVELYRDVALRVCPITREDAREMLSEVRGARVLDGYRGIPAGDVDALVDALMNVSHHGRAPAGQRQ